MPAEARARPFGFSGNVLIGIEARPCSHRGERSAVDDHITCGDVLEYQRRVPKHAEAPYDPGVAIVAPYFQRLHNTGVSMTSLIGLEQ